MLDKLARAWFRCQLIEDNRPQIYNCNDWKYFAAICSSLTINPDLLISIKNYPVKTINLQAEDLQLLVVQFTVRSEIIDLFSELSQARLAALIDSPGKRSISST